MLVFPFIRQTACSLCSKQSNNTKSNLIIFCRTKPEKNIYKNKHESHAHRPHHHTIDTEMWFTHNYPNNYVPDETPSNAIQCKIIVFGWYFNLTKKSNWQALMRFNTIYDNLVVWFAFWATLYMLPHCCAGLRVVLVTTVCERGWGGEGTVYPTFLPLSLCRSWASTVRSPLSGREVRGLGRGSQSRDPGGHFAWRKTNDVVLVASRTWKCLFALTRRMHDSYG